MYSIDHAAFIAQLSDLWAFLNNGGFAYWVLTVICGYIIYRIVASLFDDDTPEGLDGVD